MLCPAHSRWPALDIKLPCVVAETVLSLLRNPDYCVYGDGATKNPRGLDAAEEAFNEVVMEERGKFKEETLVNVGGRSRRSFLK